MLIIVKHFVLFHLQLGTYLVSGLNEADEYLCKQLATAQAIFDLI